MWKSALQREEGLVGMEHSPQSLRKEFLRQQVGEKPQDPGLVDELLQENKRLGRKVSTLRHFFKALEKSFHALQGKYDAINRDKHILLQELGRNRGMSHGVLEHSATELQRIHSLYRASEHNAKRLQEQLDKMGAREKQLEHLLVQAVEELQRMHQRVQLQVHEPQHDPKLQALLSDPKYLQTDLALHPPADSLGEGVLGKTKQNSAEARKEVLKLQEEVKHLGRALENERQRADRLHRQNISQSRQQKRTAASLSQHLLGAVRRVHHLVSENEKLREDSRQKSEYVSRLERALVTASRSKDSKFPAARPASSQGRRHRSKAEELLALTPSPPREETSPVVGAGETREFLPASLQAWHVDWQRRQEREARKGMRSQTPQGVSDLSQGAHGLNPDDWQVFAELLHREEEEENHQGRKREKEVEVGPVHLHAVEGKACEEENAPPPEGDEEDFLSSFRHLEELLLQFSVGGTTPGIPALKTQSPAAPIGEQEEEKEDTILDTSIHQSISEVEALMRQMEGSRIRVQTSPSPSPAFRPPEPSLEDLARSSFALSQFSMQPSPGARTPPSQPKSPPSPHSDQVSRNTPTHQRKDMDADTDEGSHENPSHPESFSNRKPHRKTSPSFRQRILSRFL